MPTITIAEKEVTIVESQRGEVVEVTNCASFSNEGHTTVHWSTEAFSATNEGTATEYQGGANFSAVQQVYFRCTSGTLRIQARREVL